MIRVLRSMDTEHFFKADGTPTSDVEEAVQVPNTKSALKFCEFHKLQRVEMVLRPGEGEVRIPLNLESKKGG